MPYIQLMAKAKFSLDFEKPIQALQDQIDQLRESSQKHGVDCSSEIVAIEKKIKETQKKVYSNLTPWQKIQLARHPKRPYSLDYIGRIFTDFQELHGDRAFKDDQSIVGGIAKLGKQPVMVISQQKGRNTKENIKRNFGSPYPEGYRKALRLMEMACKFNMPIITLIDTAGAFPGIGSEERHVGEAIAVNIREMSVMPVPIITAIIGEGGSGGALGMAVADEVMILENAYYSVISPEGCAAILWKDRAHAPDAAEALQITADKLLKMGIVDTVVEEPLGAAHSNYDEAAQNLGTAITKALKAKQKLSIEKLLEERYGKYRDMGVLVEAQEEQTANV